MKKKRNGRSGKLPGLRKMVLMMKLCVFFLFASFLSVAANGYSQNTRLSLMKQNASVIEVLTEISQKTDMQFLYNDNELQGIQVNVSLKNATLYEMLDKIFAGLPLSYSILDSVIVISPKGKPGFFTAGNSRRMAYPANPERRRIYIGIGGWEPGMVE